MSPAFKPSSILVCRTDRAGDLVLTLPVFTALRRHFPQARLTALVRSYTAPLLRHHPDVDAVILEDTPPRTLLQRARHLRHHSFDAAILVHPSASSILSCALAGIPVRVGRASNLWQFFLTHRQIQNRSRNEQHESRYNLELLSGLGIDLSQAFDQSLQRIRLSPGWPRSGASLFTVLPQPSLHPGDREIRWARNFITELGLDSPRLLFIHPGHGGSSFNLSPELYSRLACTLRGNGFTPCITLGPGEEQVRPLFAGFPICATAPDLLHLAALYSLGKAFIGGSTGPMHIAGAMGLPVAAIFPPVFAMTPRRWGPLSPHPLLLQPDLPPCRGRCSACSHRPINAPHCLHTLNITPMVGWLKGLIITN
jgi:ADP-heptose:LPS heptosyltransferase